jgi:hypothetical protein
MLILSSYFIVLVDYVRGYCSKNGMTWHISVKDKSAPWHDSEYSIVGKIEKENVIKTHKNLKRVIIKASDSEMIGDQIKIEKL